MRKTSTIYKTLIWDEEVSLAVLDSTALVNEAIRRHRLTPVAAAALGRTMSATAYLCSWLKDEKSLLSVTVAGDGVGGKICVSGDGKLHMRGFAENPSANLPPRADGKLDVGGFVGREGTLTVIRDDGSGIPYVGTSALVSGEIAEDFSAYFLTSEQRPTAIALGVKIGTDGKCLGAGGVFFQPLPGASEASISHIEKIIGDYAHVSTLIETVGAEGILSDIAAGCNIASRTVSYKCHCSRTAIRSLILSLGREEAESILREMGEIKVHCDYCNTDYEFGADEVHALFGGKDEGR